MHKSLHAGILAGALIAPSFPLSAQEQPAVLDDLIIEAARTGKPATALPYTVTVISREQIEEQLALGGDVAQLIGNIVPSFSPSRQKLTGFGETLRGRSPLFLIDGVPQSNPLRDGSRAGYTIDIEMIERIEVIHGANAIQGTGASGGIINYITRRAEPGSDGQTNVSAGLSTNDDFDSDSFGYRVHGQHAIARDRHDLLLAASYNQTGMFFDADDRFIGVDSTQGDTMDGSGYDLFLKWGYALSEQQRLQLSANHFEYQSNGDYVSLAGDRELGIPTSSQRGEILGIPAENDVSTISLDYSNSEMGPGNFHWQVYYQDFAAIYGGGVFGVFQDPAFGDDLYEQSRNKSQKIGSKLTYNLPGIVHQDVDLTFGLDYLTDETEQDLVQTGRSWVPVTDYVNWAPFVQADWRIGPLLITGGIRREEAELKVDDFQTLFGYGSQSVTGGSPDFGETLTNLGANWQINENWSAFAVTSEGFSMPDVGRVLRGINQPGLSVDSFLDLQPIIADNNEIGLEFMHAMGEFRISYFESDSDLGERLVPDADGVFSVSRERTEIDGVEIRAALDVSDQTRLGMNAAILDGRVDLDDDGQVDSDLGGVNIAPDRYNLYWQQRYSDVLSSRVQLNILDGRSFEEFGVPVSQFDGYETVDVVLDWRLDSRNLLQFGIENLLDEQYITYFSQVDTFPTNLDYFAGRGRNLYVTWRGSF